MNFIPQIRYYCDPTFSSATILNLSVPNLPLCYELSESLFFTEVNFTFCSLFMSLYRYSNNIFGCSISQYIIIL